MDQLYVIDIQGFQGNSQNTIVKEIAIVSLTGDYADSWIVEAPFWNHELHLEVRTRNKWKTETIHGLEWEEGDVPYSWLFTRLFKIAQTAKHLYVGDQDTFNFLRDCMTCEIVDIFKASPTVRPLPKSDRACIKHGVILKRKFNCALTNVMQMKEFIWESWRNRTIHDLTRPSVIQIQSLAVVNPATYSEIATVTEAPQPVYEEMAESPQLGLRKRPIQPKKKGTVNTLLTALLTLGLFSTAKGLVGYDCETRSQHVATLSLWGVNQCDIPWNEPNITEAYVQLLGIQEFKKTHVEQCVVSVTRRVIPCEEYANTSSTTPELQEYVLDMGMDSCRKIHSTGILEIVPGVPVETVRTNSSWIMNRTIAGHIDANNKCIGRTYSDPYGEWRNVVVQAVLHVEIQDYYAEIRFEADEITLRGGKVCTLSKGTCVDLDGGHSFWNPLPIDECNFHHYQVTYEGRAKRITQGSNENSTVIYVITRGNVTLAIPKKQDYKICGTTISYTGYPQMLLIEVSGGILLPVQGQMPMDNLSRFTSRKLRYVHLYHGAVPELGEVYNDIIQYQCNLKRRLMEASLAVATQAPDEFAQMVMGGPGHTGIVRGEVIHILKCIAVSVQARRVKECYHHLPVNQGRKAVFITPRTHIILQEGTRIPCNRNLLSIYQLKQGWYRGAPMLVITETPPQLNPLFKLNKSKGTNQGGPRPKGEKGQERIILTAERTVALDLLAREHIECSNASRKEIFEVSSLEGNERESTTTPSNVTSPPGGNEEENTTISSSVTSEEKTVPRSTMSIITSTAVFSIGVLLLVEFFIRGCILYAIYGGSLHLLGACSSAVTQVLLHGRRAQGVRNIPTNPKQRRSRIQSISKPFNCEPRESANTSAFGTDAAPLVSYRKFPIDEDHQQARSGTLHGI